MAKNTKRKNNKKGKQGGFTLIELLAVITIMGILMMVAIPSVSRTIENSRRNTFVNTAKAYINAVKNSVSQDELKCNRGGVDYISALAEGWYAYGFTTESGNTATDLMEQGGKSSWGNANVAGQVLIHKTVVGQRSKYEYAIMLVDKAGRGIGKAKATDGNGLNFVSETELGRSSINTANGDARNTYYTKVTANTKLAPSTHASDNDLKWKLDNNNVNSTVYFCDIDG